MSGYLLPGLQKLRQICNYATEDLASLSEERDFRGVERATETDLEEFNYEEELPKKRRSESSDLSRRSKKAKGGSQVQAGDSTKLQV
jgi:hypothetical protein